MWTEFRDLLSGGYQKTPYMFIWIEAPQNEAESIFYSRFGEAADDIACVCCGSNFGVTEYPDLNEPLRKFVMSGMIDYLSNVATCFIYETDIEPQERTALLRDRSYTYDGLEDDYD